MITRTPSNVAETTTGLCISTDTPVPDAARSFTYETDDLH